MDLLAPTIDTTEDESVEVIDVPGIIRMTGKVLARSVDYDTFMETEYGDVHVEWVNGVVIQMPSIDEMHDEIVLFFRILLRTFLRNIIGGGRAFGDPMLMKLESVPSSRAPDVMVLLPERLHQLKKNQVIGPANVVIEVISRGSRRIDTIYKRREYELGGVPEYWLFDGLKRSATFLHLNAAGVYEEVSPNEQGIYESQELPGFRLTVAHVWDTTSLGVEEIAEIVKTMREG